MLEAKHDQAVSLLTGLERFVRLVVEREVPVTQAYPINSVTSSEKLSQVMGVSKSYTGIYGTNSYMNNRPVFTGNLRSPGLYKTVTTPKQLTNEPNVNGVSDTTNLKNSTPQSSPQPAPRTITTQSPLPPNVNSEPINAATPDNGIIPPTGTNATCEGRSRSPQEDIQVLKPITSEEFQAMIPIHFLRPPSSSPSPDSHNVPVVTVTIKQPDHFAGDVNFPPAPTTIGKVTETITKSTLTETVVTRVTDNHLVQPIITEVCQGITSTF